MQLGVVAVVVRQTNIIWMLFVACIGVLDLIQAKEKHEENLLSVPIDDQLASSRGDGISSNLKRRRSGSAIGTASHSVRGTTLPFLPEHSSGLPHLNIVV